MDYLTSCVTGENISNTPILPLYNLCRTIQTVGTCDHLPSNHHHWNNLEAFSHQLHFQMKRNLVLIAISYEEFFLNVVAIVGHRSFDLKMVPLVSLPHFILIF